jgi:hypothetical protein
VLHFFNQDVVTVYDLALTGVARTITKGVDEPAPAAIRRSRPALPQPRSF